VVFEPYPTRIGYIGLGLAVVAGASIFFLLSRLPQQNDLPAIFILIVWMLAALAIMLLLLGWTFITSKIKYHITRNGLTINWGIAYQTIPLEQIEAILPGPEAPKLVQFRGIKLPGIQLGKGELFEAGPAKLVTTAKLTQSLFVVTPTESYIVSPANPEGFVTAWQTRQALGSTQQWQVEIHRQWPFNIPILADWLMWGLLSIGVLTCLTLFGYLAFMFAALPQLIPLQVDLFGSIVTKVDKALLFVFPTIGAVFWLANTIVGGVAYQQERLAAYFSWSLSIIIQICLWVAVYSIVSGVL